MQMTASQVEVYKTDYNQWVVDEDDDTTFSVRSSAAALVEQLVSRFQDQASDPFTAALGKRLQESSTGGWKLVEAAVYAFGLVAETFMKKKMKMDWQGFVGGILLPGIAEHQPPFVRGRCLWSASFLVLVLSADQFRPFLEAASVYLTNSHEIVPVKIFACRALSNFCPRLGDFKELPMYLSGLMQGLINVLDVLKSDTLYLVLRTLHVLLPLSEDVAERSLDAIVTRILILWAHNYKDQELVEYFLCIFVDYASIPSCQCRLQELVSPTICNLISKHSEQPFYVLETALNIANTIILHSTWPLHPLLAEQLFPFLVRFMTVGGNETLIEKGTVILKTFARVAGKNLLSWKNSEGENGVQVYLKVIARLLSDELSESTTANVGVLIEKIILLFGDEIQPVLDELLTAVLNKMKRTEGLMPKQGLLFVFVKLFLRNNDLILNYLANKRLSPNGSPELIYVLSEWIELHSSLCGGFKIKQSAIGLSKIFESSNTHFRQLNICVKSDLVVPDEGRRTRSSAKKAVYSEEPVNLRIFTLLVREHDVLMKNENPYDSSSFSDSLDNPGDDEEDPMVRYLNNGGVDPATLEVIGAECGSSTDPFLAQDGFFLDELLDMDHDLEEDEDPDIRSDPLYNINLKEFLESFFKSFAQNDPSGFGWMVEQLPPLEKKHLQTIFK
eukprot:TRINITY_DN8607_c0_g1_i3.p1 TRINITY_DN8607_c0_g1~~TRINITY_DN8607_c0_g1_i3.p1  ORF type:complete len:673 (-),score=155.31 TRINITY_DN8607_c0_g1_i3:91-2109(-)